MTASNETETDSVLSASDESWIAWRAEHQEGGRIGRVCRDWLRLKEIGRPPQHGLVIFQGDAMGRKLGVPRALSSELAELADALEALLIKQPGQRYPYLRGLHGRDVVANAVARLRTLTSDSNS